MPKGVYAHESRTPEVRKRISETLKGRASPMKGRRHSSATRQRMSDASIGRPKGPMADATKRKQSEARKGVPLSAEHRAKIYAAVPRGAEHPNWKGGTGTERHMAMERTEYKQWRSAVFLKDNFTCQICDQYSGHIHADHIKTWAEYPELRYDLNNGRTVCRACHYYITFKRKIPATSRWGLTSQEK